MLLLWDRQTWFHALLAAEPLKPVYWQVVWEMLAVKREQNSPLILVFFFPDPVLESNVVMHHQLLCKWMELTEGIANAFCSVQSSLFVFQTYKCVNNRGGENSSYTVIELFPEGTRFDATGFECFSHLLHRNFSGFCCNEFLLPVSLFLFVLQCDSDSDQEEKVRKEIAMGTKIICWICCIQLFLLLCYLFRVSFGIDLKHLSTMKILCFLSFNFGIGFQGKRILINILEAPQFILKHIDAMVCVGCLWTPVSLPTLSVATFSLGKF